MQRDTHTHTHTLLLFFLCWLFCTIDNPRKIIHTNTHTYTKWVTVMLDIEINHWTVHPYVSASYMTTCHIPGTNVSSCHWLSWQHVSTHTQTVPGESRQMAISSTCSSSCRLSFFRPTWNFTSGSSSSRVWPATQRHRENREGKSYKHSAEKRGVFLLTYA